MSVIEALVAGLNKVLSAGKIMLWVYLFSFFLVLGPTLIVSEMIEESLGQSLVAEDLITGFNDAWYREFRSVTKGFGESFSFSIAGVGAILDGVDAFLSGKIFQETLSVLCLGIFYLAMWIFLSGGVLHLYITNDSVNFEHFMRGAGIYFFRFLRLSAIAGVFYWLIYFYLLPFLEDLVREYTREVLDERIAFLCMLAKYCVVLMFLIFVNLIVDYTKIITVTKKQRSVLLAIVESCRFVLGNVGRTLSLYMVIGLLGLFFLCLYGLLAPGGLQHSWIGVIWALVLGQIYILSRIWIRLLFMASESALCRTISCR